jgi:ribosome-binding protein aMBF1 (putative translation factor)
MNLTTAIKNWEIDASSFAQVVSTGLFELSLTQRDLADKFEVAESTISRWSKGTVLPAKLVQKQVTSFFQKKLRLIQKRSAQVPSQSRTNAD